MSTDTQIQIDNLEVFYDQKKIRRGSINGDGGNIDRGHSKSRKISNKN